MRGVWWFLCSCATVVHAYRFIIIPGLGGSILYNQKSQKIWPPDISFQPVGLSVQNYYHRHDLSSTGEIGNIDSIRIDNRAVYMLTKNTYYSKMIDALSTDSNTVNAFPYDFRFIQYPEYHDKLFLEYKKYIEKEFQYEKVILVAHSMGGLLIKYFLSCVVDKTWVSKYIAKVYYINTPFGGCPMAVFFLLDSINKQLRNQPNYQFLFNNHILWMMLSIQNIYLFGGLYVCLPITKDPLLRLHQNWVYSKDIPTLFMDDDWCAHTYRLSRNFFRKRDKSLHIPEVIVYSSGKNTTVFMDYDNDSIMTGDGDGLVPIESLLYPQTWDKTPIFVHVPNQDHSNINSHSPVLDMIADNRDTLEKPSKKMRWWMFRPKN